MTPGKRNLMYVTLAIALGAVLGYALLAQGGREPARTADAAGPAFGESTTTSQDSASAEDSEARPQGGPVTPTSPPNSSGDTLVPEETILALVTDVIGEGTQLEIVVDPIEMYPVDEDAAPAPDDPSANVVYNDTKESLRFPVHPQATVLGRGDPPATIGLSGWAAEAVSDGRAYWLGILSGKVVRIEEQPIP